MAGHLDFETGKWVDDPEERSIDVGDDGLARPSGAKASATYAPEAAPAPDRKVAVGDDGLVRPMAPPASQPLSAPLTTIEKAKLIQFVNSGNGSPIAVDAARSMLAGGAPQPGLASVGPTPPAPKPAQSPMSQADQGSNLTPAQRAVILRARMRAQQPSEPMAMNGTPPGVQ